MIASVLSGSSKTKPRRENTNPLYLTNTLLHGMATIRSRCTLIIRVFSNQHDEFACCFCLTTERLVHKKIWKLWYTMLIVTQVTCCVTLVHRPNILAAFISQELAKQPILLSHHITFVGIQAFALLQGIRCPASFARIDTLHHNAFAASAHVPGLRVGTHPVSFDLRDSVRHVALRLQLLDVTAREAIVQLIGQGTEGVRNVIVEVLDRSLVQHRCAALVPEPAVEHGNEPRAPVLVCQCVAAPCCDPFPFYRVAFDRHGVLHVPVACSTLPLGWQVFDVNLDAQDPPRSYARDAAGSAVEPASAAYGMQQREAGDKDLIEDLVLFEKLRMLVVVHAALLRFGQELVLLTDPKKAFANVA